MSPSQHRSKRPFQPSITTYFARTDRSDADTSASPSPGNGLSHQHQQGGIRDLPANIQASLLNVGMRVRKAVPEGYQTHITKKIMAPSFNSSRPSMGPIHSSRAAELLPFCGIHKTGGLALQPSPIIITTPAAPDSNDNGVVATNGARPLGAHDPIFEPVYFSFSSDSNASIVSSESLRAAPMGVHKRRFVDDDSNSSDADDEGDLNGFATRRLLFPSIHTDLGGAHDDDAEVSPRTRYPVSHTVMPDLSGGVVRPFARPRTRKREGLAAAVGCGGAGRRHAIINNGVDFEDADFLQPCNDWRDEKEVEMSDV